MSKYLDNKHWLVTLEIGNAENNFSYRLSITVCN